MSGLPRLRRPAFVTRPRTTVELAIDTRRPRLGLTAAVDKDVLPLVRQALRALGQSIGATPETLHDAELALSEACSNVVRHAYRNGNGLFEVEIEVRAAELIAVVRDRGRGMELPVPGRTAAGGGLGLEIVAAVARDYELRSERGAGTEVVMALPVSRRWPHAEPAPGGDSIAELVLRRLVAMAAAQSDYSAARLGEILLAVEAVARHAPARVAGDVLRARVARGREGIELWVGPFAGGAVQGLLDRTDVPVYGSVVERIADRVRTVAAAPTLGADSREELALLFGDGNR